MRNAECVWQQCCSSCLYAAVEVAAAGLFYLQLNSAASGAGVKHRCPAWSACRHGAHFSPARCTRKDDSPRPGSSHRSAPVLLKHCWGLSAERQAVVQQLQHWNRSGYGWGEMAVLCRSNFQVSRIGWLCSARLIRMLHRYEWIDSCGFEASVFLLSHCVYTLACAAFCFSC